MLKRLFDVTLSGVGLTLSLPLWIIIALAIKLQDGGPLFYSQERVGKDGKIFRVHKFRSMIPDAEKGIGAVWASENDPRVTKIGRLLRATAMDELPQLWNIFIGDMSFVGPRAERPELVGKFSQQIPNYSSRFLVLPGLTGLAQVYGRYDTPPHQKLHYELLYVKNQSFLLDLKLVLLSFWITFRGKWENRGKKF
ncbi:MAG: sugar transferase [Candidatus Brocadiaceae bacterium]|nr:sugar transferase [Candidatus Brocadiaceae bacterium]